MLNFIVLALLNWIVSAKLHVPETLHTPEIHAGSIPRLDEFIPAFHGSAANLTNTPNFGNPNGNASVTAFGRITSTQGGENAGSRNLQVGLRLSF